jgi:hypothetical protein
MLIWLTAETVAEIIERIDAITWKIDGIAGRIESIVAQVIVVVWTALRIVMIVGKTKGIVMCIEGIAGVSGFSSSFDSSMASWTGRNTRVDFFILNLRNCC